MEGCLLKNSTKGGEIAGVIAGVAAEVALLVCIFFLPYLYRKLVLGDWQPAVMFYWAKRATLHGVERDVVSA